MANSFSLSSNVSHNLPLAVYGVVLIVAMLVWPSGIQGGLRAIVRAARPAVAGRVGGGGAGPATDAAEAAEAAEPAGEPVPKAGAKTSSEG